jgi:perosamine synthetase
MQLALHGGIPERAQPIRTTVAVTAKTRDRIDQLVADGFYSDYYNGPLAREFEYAFASWHGPASHAVAVNSGTSALHLSLAAVGVGPGDEVIVPAACYVSAATAIAQLGAVPVTCDIEPHSLTLDPAAAQRLVGPRTKAILPVHFWGYPADVSRLRELCDEHGLALVEDACQGPGAAVGGGTVGTFGDCAGYSFGNRKHIGTGEGGMVLTRTAALAERIRVLSNVGKGPGWDDYESLGYSCRMVEFSALLGLDGLARLDGEIAARRVAVECYGRALADTTLTPLPEPQWGRSVYFKLPILLPAKHLADRAMVSEAVSAENVSCRVPHRPLYAIEWLARWQQEHGRYRSRDDCPVAAELLPRVIEVETGPNLTEDEADVSARAVLKVWRYVNRNSPG